MTTVPRVFRCVLFIITLSGIACSQESPPQTSATTDPAFTKSDKAIPAPSTPETQIVTAIVTVEPSHPVLSLAGKVSYGEDRYSKVSSALIGRVQKIHGQLGDFVKAGELLVAIESPEIASAYSEFIKEHSDLSYAQRSYGLAKDLYEIKALPQKDLKQAENDFVKAKAEFRRARERLLALQVSKEELDKPIADQTITSIYQIRSPLSGTIVDRAVTPGQSVSGDPNQVLFTVADLNTVQVIADVYDRDLGLVKIKQQAMVTVEAYPETAFPATISSIGDVVDQTTRTIKIRAVVNNSDHKLKPGMFARLNVKLSESRPYPLIPQEAVLEIDGNMYVYVANSDNHYMKRPIKTGLPSSGQMSVLSGLEPGETIVVKGAVLLKGQDMNVEDEGMSSEHTPPPSPPTS
ncbi:efflux RND transporter periplasmic adaptor subunit [uncultured Nitrospira sp.]|uniref:efflux RND transporter periplasmic adaptor subunit n=1 Tax=uncultured Nitrospira sp. TaxID=157176 RepID=UPI00314073F6